MRSLKLLVLLVSFAAPLAAQQFGQWSWQVNLRAGGRQYDHALHGQVLSEYQENTLGLGVNVNGFFIHPGYQRWHQPLFGRPRTRIELLGRHGFFSPLFLLGLTASHRQDRRRIPGEPWLNSQHQEVGITSSLRAYQIQVSAFRFEDRWNLGQPRENRGLSWTISRAMGGWLPIVSAPPRRGVIK